MIRLYSELKTSKSERKLKHQDVPVKMLLTKRLRADMISKLLDESGGS